MQGGAPLDAVVRQRACVVAEAHALEAQALLRLFDTFFHSDACFEVTHAPVHFYRHPLRGGVLDRRASLGGGVWDVHDNPRLTCVQEVQGGPVLHVVAVQVAFTSQVRNQIFTSYVPGLKPGAFKLLDSFVQPHHVDVFEGVVILGLAAAARSTRSC
jgi:hypothetical protein